MLFDDLNLIMPIKRALRTEGYNKPTPIQERAIPSILAGRDILGVAQTGTGKTAAFAVPILQNLSNERSTPGGKHHIRALILAPTRELAIQIGESFGAYGQYLNFRTMVIYGGVSQNYQTDALEAGVDILVATPGRLLDLIGQRFANIRSVEMFVLDEADRMLDMGMVHDVKKIIELLPKKRQNMLFSATMPPGVSELVDSILVNPAKIEVKPETSNSKNIKQAIYFVDEKDRIPLLIHILKNKSIVSALVFTRTKHRADKVAKALGQEGIRVQAIHGDKSQGARQAALNSFKNREIRVLVATDVAARGIDVEELSHVINFDLPNIPETYVHRIGRTGRAGMGGTALSFCDHPEIPYLKEIEKLIAKPIPIIKDHPYSAVNFSVERIKNSGPKTTAPKPAVKGQAAKTVSKASAGKSSSKIEYKKGGNKSKGKQWPEKGIYKKGSSR